MAEHPSNYGYLNARLRSMKSELLPVGEVERMLHAGSVASLIRLLEDSPYGVAMTQSLTRFSGLRAIEEALGRNLMASYRKLLSVATGQARHLIELLLGRWDLYNIKTILRGIQAAAEPETLLEQVVPAGRLDVPALQELARRSDINAVLDLLATWNVDYVQPLLLARQKVVSGDLFQLEYELDTRYFEQSLGELHGNNENHQEVRHVLETEIDITNIMTTLRTVHDGIDREQGAQVLLEHGTFERAFLLELLQCDQPVDILERLERTRYAYAVEKGILFFGETGNISIIEKFLEEILIRRCAKKFYRGNPLGIALAIGYIWLKYNEFLNLRLIARGLAFGMPVNAIHEELVLV
ncbi:hypothetical protein GF339_07025 [candidate division KSB3 bacterium]|uniref:V-type ATP synthase subunit C n=1 Tax=candidate division KSB3 bacterium TaxID=2044937 RepID=A0A9D5JUC9_9BACT|nr:hypothetical protein [candidate division KSB3 bacterium]MBD3324320.1 hypothetical protein [candidate division KSB3 bacterium]